MREREREREREINKLVKAVVSETGRKEGTSMQDNKLA